MNKALEYIKSKHNGEIPYKYGSNECAKLMTDFAEYHHQKESDFQEMFECLRDLMDLQNGCPLPTYKDAYNETVDRCEKALAKYEEEALEEDLPTSNASQQSELLVDFWMNLPNTNKNKGVAKHYVDEYLKSKPLMDDREQKKLDPKIERIIAFVANEWGNDHRGSTRGILGNDAIEICKNYGIDWANYR